MAMIECLNCDSGRVNRCDGCNVYRLTKMLRRGKLDCLMDEHHAIVRAPESSRKKGAWITHEKFCCNSRGEPVVKVGEVYVCSECGRREVDREPFCARCGAEMTNSTRGNENG